MAPPQGRGITLRLERLEHLFSPPEFGEFGGSADVPSGIERLVAELKATPNRDAPVTVVVPDADLDPGVQERLGAAVRAYATVRLHDVQQRRVALRREGMRSLLYAVPIVVLLSALSVLVTTSGVADEWRTAIDGLLIVLEWVALWYPLDTLFWYGRPLTQEMKVLDWLGTAPLTVLGSSSLSNFA